MTRNLLSILITLSGGIHPISAGNTGSKSLDACLNRPNPLLNQRWACENPQLLFPTVACLTQDILTCGKVTKDKTCVFYSFGAQGSDAANYCSQDLEGVGIRFHEVLDDDYLKKVIGNPKFGLQQGKMPISLPTNDQNLNRKDIYVRKLAQAFASVCQGEAFLMVLHYQGDGGGIGIYQNPRDPDGTPECDKKDNVWQLDEFPSLTQGRVRKISSVDISNNCRKEEDWVQGIGGKREPRPADAISLPPIPPGMPSKYRRRAER